MSRNRNSRSIAAIPLLIVSAAICSAAAIGPPDTNCNPAIDTPATGGCTWYNFYAHEDNTITGGSSFTNYYVAASDPAWTIVTALPTDFIVLDGGHQGDVFSVYDNGVKLGSTSATSIDANHSCANDTTGAGTDPAACWNDPLMSRGTFLLGAGNHSLTVTWDQRVTGGDSTLQWFEIGNAPIGTVPEPSTAGLFGSGVFLIAAGLLLRRYVQAAFKPALERRES